MDFATVLGLIIAVGAILGAFTIEGGNIAAIFMAGPILIVVGGTFGATMITTSMKTVFSLPTYLRLAFTGISLSTHSTIELIVKLAEKARREGILGLESDMREVKDRFLKKAIQLVIDGTEVSTLKEILDSEMTYLEERHKKGIDFFQKAGGFAPTMGILGTVLGLVHTLGNTDDAGKMAAAIAAAFIATLWGVALANVFLLPIADKLRLRHEEEMSHWELITEGVVAIQSGDNPRNIKTRLHCFIPPHTRDE
ncbi:MAG: MotA/TolQ/ExbB proton channel family protein [candidate division Zixibacteria bacterium]|nr:MotA/TolQ/ExbB proton channel family protein [candidate division Zixibacteria bacterium]